MTPQRKHALQKIYQQYHARHSDLICFARLVDFSVQVNHGDLQRVMADINYLVLNAANNWLAIFTGLFERVKYTLHYRYPWIPHSVCTERFGSTGFAADDDSNQVQHFWYFVVMAYQLGRPLGEAWARYHEWNPTGLLRYLPLTGGGHGTVEDLELSLQAIDLALALKRGDVTAEDLGDWLRRELGN